MPNQSVVSFAHRNLKRLERYRDLYGDKDDAASYVHGVPLRSEETLIGVYENSPGTPEDNVFVTDSGLHYQRNTKWERLVYSEITEIVVPENKTKARELVTRTRDQEVRIPIRGGTGRFRDVFLLSSSCVAWLGVRPGVKGSRCGIDCTRCPAGQSAPASTWALRQAGTRKTMAARNSRPRCAGKGLTALRQCLIGVRFCSSPTARRSRDSLPIASRSRSLPDHGSDRRTWGRQMAGGQSDAQRPAAPQAAVQAQASQGPGAAVKAARAERAVAPSQRLAAHIASTPPQPQG